VRPGVFSSSSSVFLAKECDSCHTFHDWSNATSDIGEIRDEAAVGRGSTTKAGLAGFFVSDLRIPGHEQPWEVDIGKPFQVSVKSFYACLSHDLELY
jgi:hypothetical protein